MDGECGPSKKRKLKKEVSLPLEIISEVLSRLPVKSLLKLRSVCKSWCNLISEPHFINLQMDRAKEFPQFIVMGDKGPGDMATINLYSHRKDGVGSNLLLEWEIPGDGTLQMNPFTCHGLVLFYAKWQIYICNPSTREFGMLPEGNPSTRELIMLPEGSPRGLYRCGYLPVGFGFDPSTRKYKVVRPFYRWMNLKEKSFGFGFEVLTLGSDTWRELKNPPYAVYFMFPAFVNGSLYWDIPEARQNLSNCILSFDLRTEEFGVVPIPTYQRKTQRFVRVLGGNLCLSDVGIHCTDIWMLKDPNKHEWTKEYHINFDGVGLRYPVGIVDGDVLFSSTRAVYFYSKMSKSFRKVLGVPKVLAPDPEDDGCMSILDGALYLRCGLYIESLVPIEGAVRLGSYMQLSNS